MNIEHYPKTTIVIFGATGDLAKRKLFPSLFNLFQAGKLSEHFTVVGLARREWTNDTLREVVRSSISGEEELVNQFCTHFYYSSFDVTDEHSYVRLNELLEELELRYGIPGNRIFYMSTSPQFFGVIAANLKSNKLTETPGWTRLIIEKPFGRDLLTAHKLNNEISEAFSEDEIYRIDHYLGKEMVQNIEVIRFANSVFEPLWNNQYISNVQITLSETLGVEDRGGYYDTSGAMRDMVQNHIMQLVSLLAMDPPIRLTSEEIRHEKIKVLRALKPVSETNASDYFVRGQYTPGTINGEEVPGYRSEENVNFHSLTETFVAGKLLIENHRWTGVPFYIRTGKRLKSKATKVVIEFKNMPLNLYFSEKSKETTNLLVINIQPDEGISLVLNGKKIGTSGDVTPVQLEYNTKKDDFSDTQEAYERLIHNCIIGDATNFAHSEEVLLSWKYVDPILNAWETKEVEMTQYNSGSMGPKAADDLLAKDLFKWWEV